MGGHRLVPIATALLMVGAMFALGSPPAAAERAPEVVSVESRGFVGSAVVDVPAGGTGTVTSGDLDKKTKHVNVVLAAVDGDYEARDHLMFALGVAPTRGALLLTCLYFSYIPNFSIDRDAAPVELDEEAASEALVAMVTCLHLAQLLDAPPARATTLRAVCQKDPGRIPASMEKTEDGYRLVVNGTMRPAAKKSPLKVSCKTKGKKLVLGIQPKKKGKSLRSVVGKNLSVGLASPTDSEEGASVKVSFQKK